MRILLINTFYYPNIIGGTENSIKILCENLINHGHQVAVYTVDRNINNKRYEEINGVQVYRYNVRCFEKIFAVGEIGYKILQHYNPFIRSELEELIQRFRPNIAHTNNLYGISTYIWNVLRGNNIPIVHTLRDYWLVKAKRVPKALLSIYQLKGKRYMDFVNLVTAPSEFILNDFLKKGCFKKAISEVVPNCVNFDGHALKEVIRLKRSRTTNHIKFLFVGTLDYHKGIDRLLYAFSSIDHINISLVICGQGPLEEMVKDFAKKDKRIIYKGQIIEEKLKEIYLDCDVLIVPSIWEEPFGRVIIEGNLCGMPVIASKVGGIPEIMKRMNSGILINLLNETAFEDAIMKMCDRDLIKSFFPNIETNMKYYSAQNQLTKFLTLYKQII